MRLNLLRSAKHFEMDPAGNRQNLIKVDKRARENSFTDRTADVIPTSLYLKGFQEDISS